MQAEATGRGRTALVLRGCSEAEISLTHRRDWIIRPHMFTVTGLLVRIISSVCSHLNPSLSSSTLAVGHHRINSSLSVRSVVSALTSLIAYFSIVDYSYPENRGKNCQYWETNNGDYDCYKSTYYNSFISDTEFPLLILSEIEDHSNNHQSLLHCLLWSYKI